MVVFLPLTPDLKASLGTVSVFGRRFWIFPPPFKREGVLIISQGLFRDFFWPPVSIVLAPSFSQGGGFPPSLGGGQKTSSLLGSSGRNVSFTPFGGLPIFSLPPG